MKAKKVHENYLDDDLLGDSWLYMNYYECTDCNALYRSEQEHTRCKYCLSRKINPISRKEYKENQQKRTD